MYAPAWEPAFLTALAAGGLAVWVERGAPPDGAALTPRRRPVPPPAPPEKQDENHS
jgi:hypothetical protein